ncbi:MAG: type IX secretion system membrane protein PorP/SprF [Bacteroidales bacterium]|nr:type IX secretion system membrane protein PorP/SprF [Bacteroidales bacterium]
MRRIVLLIIVLIGIFVKYSQAQIDSHYSLFEYVQNVYNPGAAGSNDALCVSSVHRQQWVGWEEGRPVTTVFTFDMPISAMSSGVGLSIVEDQIGFSNNLNIMLNYAYRLELSDGVLGMGLGLGVFNHSIDGDWVTWESMNGQPVYIDPTIPHMENVTAFDANIGITYNAEDFWVGLSATHVPGSTLNYDIENPSKLTQHVYLTGGYNYSLPNPSFDLIGSGMMQSDLKTIDFQINAKLLYEKKFWGGISYRHTDAIVPMIGIHLINGISFGYSYDVVLSNVGSYNSGSHELMLRYCFNVGGPSTPGRYRSVRRL